MKPTRCKAYGCNNEIHPRDVRGCGVCGQGFMLCPECGGTERAEQLRQAHEQGHDPNAKRATCRWCDWKSETGYVQGDEWSKERAFEEQRRHVAVAHPRIMKQIRTYLDR